MKSFLEEYGFAILSAIVVIVLILMISPLGMTIRSSLVASVEQFGEVGNTAFQSVNVDDLLSTNDSNPSVQIPEEINDGEILLFIIPEISLFRMAASHFTL